MYCTSNSCRKKIAERVACRLNNVITTSDGREIKLRFLIYIRNFLKCLRERKREKGYKDCREIIMIY